MFFRGADRGVFVVIRVSVRLENHLSRLIAHNERIIRRTLYKVGGYGRAVVKNSFRKRKGASVPPNPPHSHVGSLRDLAAFRVDPRDVTIGVGFKRRRPGGDPPVPELLGGGGRVAVVSRDRRGRRRRTMAVYKPRPFIGPARSKTLARLPVFIGQASR